MFPEPFQRPLLFEVPYLLERTNTVRALTVADRFVLDSVEGFGGRTRMAALW